MCWPVQRLACCNSAALHHCLATQSAAPISTGCGINGLCAAHPLEGGHDPVYRDAVSTMAADLHLVSLCSKRPCYIRRLPTTSALPSGPNPTCRPRHSAASLLVDSIRADSSCFFVARVCQLAGSSYSSSRCRTSMPAPSLTATQASHSHAATSPRRGHCPVQQQTSGPWCWSFRYESVSLV
jgi:hypothetical protein